MFGEVISKIKEYNTIVIARHKGVDPDALCSQLALRDSIRMTYPDKNVFAFGTSSSKFTSFGSLDKIVPVDNALLIVLDTPDIKRIDLVNINDFKEIIKIDHHPFVEKFANIEIIDDQMSSTSEIIMNFIYESELLCNKDIAELLYMGLVSDSNRFLFNSCDAKTFKIVSYYLDKYNFDISKVYQKLYLRPLSEVRLHGFISLNMNVTDNGLGYIVIKDDDLKRFNVDSASAGNMVNDFNYISEILVWATITEDVKNLQYRVSIRSRGPEINRIVEAHGGGGHRFASGLKAKSLEDAIKLMDALDSELQKYKQIKSEGNNDDNK